MDMKSFGSRFIGRIVAQYKSSYKVMTEKGFVAAAVSGKFRLAANSTADFPAVGDFVLLDRDDDGSGQAVILELLARKSVLIRRAAGTAGESQVIAANLDLVFICMALNGDFNLRRLERYLSLVFESGAKPVVLLTKADLCESVEEKLKALAPSIAEVKVISVSNLYDEGYEEVRALLLPGVTAAFIGSSGVGKSTLINRLLGSTVLATKAIRDDDKGRHTTTHRELFLLPEGGIVIDTPGMRELALENADVDAAFADIATLSANCRFRDCEHQSEPGCAVRKALEEGTLTQARLESWRKLRQEASYAGMNSRQIEEAKTTLMFADFGGKKNARRMMKENKKRRF